MKVMYKMEPKPTDSHKSFYGKCEVYVMEDGTKVMFSYDTLIASQEVDGTIHRYFEGMYCGYNGRYGISATTSRHIRSVFNVDMKYFKNLQVENLPKEYESVYHF